MPLRGGSLILYQFRKKKAFTLIELIMTIVVVSIMAIPLSLTLSQQMESMFQSRYFTEALNLARLEMERVNNMNYNNIAIGVVNTLNYQGYSYDVTTTVACVQGVCGPPGPPPPLTPESVKQITVTIRRSGSPTTLVTLITYLARNVQYPF